MFAGYELTIMAFLYVAFSEFLVYKFSKNQLIAFLIIFLIFAVLYYFVLPMLNPFFKMLIIYSFIMSYQTYFILCVFIFAFIFYVATKLYNKRRFKYFKLQK